MKTNITFDQQEQLTKYAKEKRIFLFDGHRYIFTDYALHENEIDIYIVDESGEKDSWGIECWKLEEFFGWFDAYHNANEEKSFDPIKHMGTVIEPIVNKQKSAPKEPKVIKQKNENAMRNNRVSPLFEPIYEFVKNSKEPIRGVEIAKHIGINQNKLDYYIKKLVNAERIFKTPDKHYTTDKNKAGNITRSNAGPVNKSNVEHKNGKSKALVIEMVDTVYKIDFLLERMKEQKRFHEIQTEKLGKMIEIWEVQP